jgi:type I restriction enzyme S subunit
MEAATKSGFKITELGLIPSDWEVLKFTDCANLKHGFQFREEHFSKAGIKVVKIGTLIDGGGLNFDHVTYVPLEYLNRFGGFVIQNGDVLMALTGATLGKIAIVNSNEILLQNYRVGNFYNKGNSLKEYVFYLLQSDYIQKTISKLVNEAAQPNLGKGDFDKFIVPLPPLPEQTAIATSLKDTDDLINSLENLIAKKKLIKQGAMQELLKPKEGWVEMRLGEVIYLQGGYAFKSNLFTNDGIPIIRISDVGNDAVETTNSVCYEPFDIPTDFWAKKGDILIAMSGATTGKIGIYSYEKIAYINQRVGKFVVKNEIKTSNEFISHIVRSEKFKELLTKEIAQGAQPNISGKQIESIILSMPIEKNDQVSVAEILSEMNAEISLIEKKLFKLRTIKQGMMQQLLTGKIRLI